MKLYMVDILLSALSVSAQIQADSVAVCFLTDQSQLRWLIHI